MARGPVRFEATAGRIGPCGRSTTRPKPSRESEVAHEHPLAVNGENSRAKVQNVRGDSSVAFPGSPLRSLRTPAQTHQNLPHMTLVIAHPKLFLDQVRHPRAGPQRSFIAQLLRPADQELLELLPLLLI